MSIITGRLQHLGAIRFSGADAATFLQGQLSNDTRRLAAGEPLLASYNSSQGRVLALLFLIPQSDGTIGVLPRELVTPTIESMRKYVLRAKVRLDDVSQSLAIVGAPDGATALETVRRPAGSPCIEPLSAATRYREASGVGFARLGKDDARVLIVGAPDAIQTTSPRSTDGATERAWRLADVRAGRPQVYPATRELFVAQMLNLDVLDAISFTKGCYTGQEIIARTQHLGRIKRRLFRVKLSSAEWHVGDTVHMNDGREGRIAEIGGEPGNLEALAVLPLDAANPNDRPGGLEIGSEAPSLRTTSPTTDAQLLPLPYSL